MFVRFLSSQWRPGAQQRQLPTGKQLRSRESHWRDWLWIDAIKKNIFFATFSCTGIFRNCGNLDLFSSKSVELSFIWLSEDQGLLPLCGSIEAKSYLIGGKISKSILSKVEWVDASIGLKGNFFLFPMIFKNTWSLCALISSTFELQIPERWFWGDGYCSDAS